MILVLIQAENDATKRREIIGTLQKGSPTTGQTVCMIHTLWMFSTHYGCHRICEL